MGIETLHAELDRLASAELSGDAATLGSEVCELDRALNRLMAEKSRRLAAFDRAEGYVQAGQSSAKGWLAGQTLTSRGQAAAEVGVARLRGRLPLLHAAWDAGKTTFDHLRHVEINLRKLPEELWGEVDAGLTERARTTTAQKFGAWLRELAQSLGGEPKPRDETQHESRRLSMSLGFNGMTNLVGRLTPEVAEKLHAALSACSRPDAAGEVRFKNQRQADALDALLDLMLGSGRLPGEGGVKPQLNLSVDLNQIDEEAQRAEEARQRPVDWFALSDEERTERLRRGLADADAGTDPSSGRPRFYWTGPTSTSTARRLSCDGVLLPIFTRDGTQIDLGRSHRLVSPQQRKLIEARDRHCQWPDCDLEGRLCVVHHVVFWREGGPTDRWNLLLLCPHHHRAAHDGRFTVVLHAPGKITTRARTRPEDPYYDIRLEAPPPPTGACHDALDPPVAEVRPGAHRRNVASRR